MTVKYPLVEQGRTKISGVTFETSGNQVIVSELVEVG
jgi:hypothetical protein